MLENCETCVTLGALETPTDSAARVFIFRTTGLGQSFVANFCQSKTRVHREKQKRQHLTNEARVALRDVVFPEVQ